MDRCHQREKKRRTKAFEFIDAAIRVADNEDSGDEEEVGEA